MHVLSCHYYIPYIQCTDVHLGLHRLMMQIQELEIINRRTVEDRIHYSALVSPPYISEELLLIHVESFISLR